MKKLFVGIIFALGLTALAHGQIVGAFVQGSSGPLVIGTPVNIGTANSSTALTSFTFTTIGAVVAGDLLAIAVSTGGAASVNLTAVTVGTNTLSKAQSANGGGAFAGVNSDLWYICGAAAASSGATVTVTSTGWTGTTYYMAALHRVPGVLATGCLDVAPAATVNNSNGTTCSAATGTLAQAVEYVLGFVTWNGTQTITEPGGFTVIGSTLQNSDGLTQDYAYQKSAATTTITYAPTSASQKNMCMVAAFK